MKGLGDRVWGVVAGRRILQNYTLHPEPYTVHWRSLTVGLLTRVVAGL